MSNRMRFWMIGGALVLALAVAGGALAQGMHHGMGHGFNFEGMLSYYADALDLTSAQQDQIKSIWAKEKTNIEPLMQQMHQFHGDMEKLTDSGTFDEAKVRTLATQESQNMVELTVQHARVKSEMLQVLSPEQRAKFAQLQAKHEQRMQDHMQHMQAPPPPEE
jgi:periplasmic protein CpxP/Spy